ncbi:MAG TPA: hypothetical protein DCX21_06600 [Eubacterium sp.]|nr:hypothetical protein [Eubacterium sp.]HBZ52488.1 hypothetical protein [Eubacterium sp.]
MKRRDRIIAMLIAVVLLMGLGGCSSKGKQRSISGIPDPIQTKTEGSTTMSKAGYDINILFLYEYDIDALVVSTKRYKGSSLADKIAPVDLALAWGSAAAYNTECNIKWSQSGRWYYWECRDSSAFTKAGGEDGINKHSSNHHLIPATSDVEKKIKAVKIGDRVHIKGYLVNVNASDKSGHVFDWYTSISRDDTGDGACEVVYVKEIEVQ